MAGSVAGPLPVLTSLDHRSGGPDARKRRRAAAQAAGSVTTAMLTPLDLRGAGSDLRDRLPRPGADDEPVEAVRDILAAVRDKGDVAVRELTARFDGVDIDDLRVPVETCRDALARSGRGLRQALEAAHDAIEAFHRTQRQEREVFERDGIRVESRLVPVDRAGCYVPGGRAVYPSTVLMTAVPARVAGVGEVVLAVPRDRRTGLPPDATLAAAALAGVDEVYRIGGAQAIGALAYGTDTVRPVDVIVGPGSVYVAVAKREVAGEGRVGVPSAFAGPSEVVVVADDSVAPDLAAIDVIVQAEHGPAGLAWLVTWSEAAADSITPAFADLAARASACDERRAPLGASDHSVLAYRPH